MLLVLLVCSILIIYATNLVVQILVHAAQRFRLSVLSHVAYLIANGQLTI